MAKRLNGAARIFTACITVMLLGATVMYRADHDGYQGTHLFFMPRKNWEMDFGRGMLYEEEHYRGMDLRAIAEEVYGKEIAGEMEEESAKREQDHYEARYEEYDEYEEYEEYEEYGEHDTWADYSNHDGPILRRMPHAPNLDGNTIPLAGLLSSLLANYGQPFSVRDTVDRPHNWLDDPPTPPPRTPSCV
ncbi:MAG TPA: hypothetical protein VEX13_10445 [Chloroflexia bacterium]|nr:hypothetical protein [Chloroflexia bacterium]